MSPAHTTKVMLPKIEVPKLNDIILNCRNFWEQFNVSVDSVTQTSKLDKLVYLSDML